MVLCTVMACCAQEILLVRVPHPRSPSKSGYLSGYSSRGSRKKALRMLLYCRISSWPSVLQLLCFHTSAAVRRMKIDPLP